MKVVLVGTVVALIASITAVVAIANEAKRDFRLSFHTTPDGTKVRRLEVDGVHCNYGILIFRDGEITGGCIQ